VGAKIGAECRGLAAPAVALFGLGLNHDAEHALGLILRQPERLDGVLDRESVGDQSAGQLRSRSQEIGRLDEVPAYP
jgi:hypothetical protein